MFNEKIEEYVLKTDIPKEEIGNSSLINYYYHHGKIAAKELYKKKPDITAVICFNDEVALGLMSGLQNLGVKIPKELSITGIDANAHSAYSFPSLTTVKVPAIEIGEECVQRLICKIEGKKLPNLIEHKIEVIPRKSVKDIKNER